MGANDEEVILSLRENLEVANEAILAQKEFIEHITEPPFAFATVLDIGEEKKQDTKGESSVNSNGKKAAKRPKKSIKVRRVLLGNGDTLMEIWAASDVVKKLKLKAGSSVKLNSELMTIADEPVSQKHIPGDIVTVTHVMDKKYCEVTINEQVRTIFYDQPELEVGDRVLLDKGNMVVTYNLGKGENQFQAQLPAVIHWEDIGGLEEAKQEMQEAVELPHTNPGIFEKFGKEPIKGILLYGPPGCGKTLIGKAVATSLAKIYGAKDGVSEGFIYVKGPEILDRYVGVAEATIRRLFEYARVFEKEKGYPAVIFIDEADSILGRRGNGISSDMEKTIVPMFLTEMDGLQKSGALIILATNRPDVLDPAVVREGRIDRKIKIGRPTKESAEEIFRLNLNNTLLDGGEVIDNLSKTAADVLFSDEKAFYRIHTKEGIFSLSLGDLCSGGMIATIVEQAIARAIRRELSSGKSKKPSGVTKEDLTGSVGWMRQQQNDVNHRPEIEEIGKNMNTTLLKIEKIA